MKINRKPDKMTKLVYQVVMGYKPEAHYPYTVTICYLGFRAPDVFYCKTWREAWEIAAPVIDDNPPEIMRR